MERFEGSAGTRLRSAHLALLAAALLVLVLAQPALAKSYSMPAVDITAQVEPDGDIHVVENRTFDFDGDFTFAAWTLNKTSQLGMFDIDVLSVSVDGVQHTLIDDPSADETRPDGTYRVADLGDSLDVRVFFRKSNTRSTVRLEYLIHGGALKWDDTSEVYWQFVGDETELPSDDVRVHIILPEGVSRDQVKAWAHGPLTGVVTINDDASVDLTVDHLPEYTFVEARVLFPRDALPDAQPRSGPRYESVLAEEARWAREANAERVRARILVGAANIAAVLVPLIALVVNTLLFFRYGKEYEPAFRGEYFRELPAELSPAVVDALLRWGQVSDDGLAATLMDLVNRGAVSIEPVIEQRPAMLGLTSKEEQTYRLTYAPEKSKGLSRHEQELLHHLVTTMAGSGTLTLTQLRDLAKASPEKYVNGIKAWKKAVKDEYESHGFVEKGIGRQMGTFLLALLGFAAGFAPIMVGGIGWFLLFAIPVSAIAAIEAFNMRRRSREANELTAKYRALERYLKDFGRLDEKPPTHVVLWEHFLVLAVVFGIADQVIDALRVKAPEVLEDPAMRTAYWMTYPSYGGVSPVSAVKSGMVSAASVASSQMSSSSGGGGGFSGGGGGGGGGGGVSAG
ncbi:MAG: DUF2207 domain-containing protein [Coriobacteriia bacterium]